MHLNERGIALVTVIVMAAVLMVVGSLVAYKVMNSSRGAAVEGSKTKAYYAANAGIEWARRELSLRYSNTGKWNDLLSESPEEGRYPANPQLKPPGGIDSIPVRIYIRDNIDDNDYKTDNDLWLFVLSEAEARDGSKTIVEAQCFLGTSGAYGLQAGDGAEKGGTTKSGVADVKTAQVSQE